MPFSQSNCLKTNIQYIILLRAYFFEDYYVQIIIYPLISLFLSCFLTSNAALADDSFDDLFKMPEVKTENHTVATVPLQVPVLMMSLQKLNVSSI